MPYDRIVSLAPSNTEILYALGAEDAVVATTALCDYPPAAEEQPSVGGWTNPDVDAVRERDPDLVLASDALQDEAVDRCSAAGLPVKQFTPTRLQEVFDTIDMIGELVGRTAEAQDLVETLQERVRTCSVSFPAGRPRVYCEEWHRPPMVGGNWIPEIVRRIGGDYLIEEGERSRHVSLEEIQEFDPEYVFLHYCGFGDAADPDTVKQRDGWEDVAAVETGNVYVIDDSLLNRPGPRLVEGMHNIREKIVDDV